ncbi:MAG: chloride channel protein [Fibrobacter sp.]|nr:chloride channel protein [Fibrobacter sp.]
MKMAKAQLKAKVGDFLKKWFSLPVLTVVAAALGAAVGAMMACFGDILIKIGFIRDAHPLYFIPFLALAGAGIALLYRKFGKGSERGMGVVFAVGQGKENHIPLRLIPMVAVTTWITHLFGGSAGREGVAVQIGATLGHNISKKFPIENAGHILLLAGMAAGFSGLFQIPLAATAFALEVLIVGHLDLMALLPAAAAAFAACKVSNMLGLEKFSIDLNALLAGSHEPSVANMFVHDGSLDIYFVMKLALIGVLFGIVGGGFAKLLSIARNFLEKKFPDSIKRIAILGAILAGLFLLLGFGRYCGLGTNLIDLSFVGVDGTVTGVDKTDWILKFVLTILTLAAGFKGGEVTPLFSIGATLGAVAATTFGLPFPLAAALGYAAVFGSATNTLLAPILIGCEVFGFDTLPAFFVVCIIAYVCNANQSVYNQKKLKLKF